MYVTIDWNEKMSFFGVTPSGHKIEMDAGPEVGGESRAATPMELLLHAVAGCTGMDIVSILRKMRLEPSVFRMEVRGDRADEHPKRFTDIHIHYALDGDLPEEKVVRAIKLSKDKYCSVSKSLNANIKASYSLNGELGEQEFGPIRKTKHPIHTGFQSSQE